MNPFNLYSGQLQSIRQQLGLPAQPTNIVCGRFFVPVGFGFWDFYYSRELSLLTEQLNCKVIRRPEAQGLELHQFAILLDGKVGANSRINTDPDHCLTPSASWPPSPSKVLVEGIGEGETTSGTYSPTLERSIGLARVPSGTGERVRVDIRGKWLDARVVRPPFVRNGKALIGI